MITISGQLAIKTIHGRNGDFNVGRLSTSLCEFTVKNPELDQYKEGKYDGEFTVVEIRPSMYHTAGRMIIEMRATLGGMVLSTIDRLSKDEAQQLSPQEIDPIDEESQASQAAPAVSQPMVTATPKARDPLTDTRPFGFGTPQSPATEIELQQDVDSELFGNLWPLTARFKLDATVDRRRIRQQRDRLNDLKYDFDPITQEWFRDAD